jgi:hypothetical protein
MITPSVRIGAALRRVLISFFDSLEIQRITRSAPRASSPPDVARLLVRSVTPRAGRAVEAVSVNPRGLKDHA